jgi:excisionase family DNA binding protein
MRLFGLPALEQLTGIPQRTFRQYMSEGRLRYSRIGRRIMVAEEDLRAFVVANRVEPKKPAPSAAGDAAS